ncbi:MAG: glycosyltransferase, partial [Thermoplasmata archaeon]|nr:glycosyltransferase [Thermoplasmata archaeon]
FLGALDPAHSYKRLDLLLRALADLPDTDVPIELEVVGDGASRAVYEALADRLGVSDFVRFEGHLTDLEVARRLHDAWAIVLPAVTDQEGFGTAAIEAIHYGCPFVTSSS